MTTNGRSSIEGALLAPDGLDHVQALAAWMQAHPNDRDTRRAVEDLLNTDANGPKLRDWAWLNLADAADIPAPNHTISGLLVEGKITLWWSPVKTGKSTALMAMLKALSPGGPEFYGMALAEARQDLVDFDGENFMGKNICSL